MQFLYVTRSRHLRLYIIKSQAFQIFPPFGRIIDARDSLAPSTNWIKTITKEKTIIWNFFKFLKKLFKKKIYLVRVTNYSMLIKILKRRRSASKSSPIWKIRRSSSIWIKTIDYKKKKKVIATWNFFT